MKLALFQTDTITGAPLWNIDKVSRWIEGLPDDTDLAVLPESFDTGDSALVYGRTETDIADIAIKCNISVCYNKGNKLIFIHPSGKIETDKILYKGIRISQEPGCDLAIFSVSSSYNKNGIWKEFAVRNRCYVAAVERVGYQNPGISSIIDFMGECIVSSDPGLECSISAEIFFRNFDEHF